MLVVVVAVFFTVFQLQAHIPTIRETLPPPPALVPMDVCTEEFTLLYSSESLSFYHTPKGNFAIADHRGDAPFLWMSGLEIPFNSEADEMLNTMSADELVELSVAREYRLSDFHVGFARSIIWVEFFDPRNNMSTTIGNASQRGVNTEFFAVDGDSSHYVLQMNLTEVDISVDLHIRFMATGMELHVPETSIQGEDSYRIASIVVAPFLGAGGGARMHFNPDTNAFDINIPNEMPPAYALLPDGSGALARFRENYAELSMYRRSVFGTDVSHNFNHTNSAELIVTPFDPLMPVYGVAHGHNEFAFFAHATSGGEFMEVIFRPAQNTTLYNNTYARFEYNRFFFQVFNQLGAGYQSLLDQPNRFDLTMHIEFLAGDGEDGFAANYVGMALYYRDFLLNSGQLTPARIPQTSDIPIHIDIMMSDARQGLAGLNNVVVTTADDVEELINIIREHGVYNINASLMGFKNNGFTAARIDRNNFTSSIGSRRDFEQLVNRFAPLGVDISFSQDYANINTHNASFMTHAVRHINGRYVENDLDQLSAWAANMPVTSTGLLRTDRATAIIRDFADTFDFMESMTLMGITNQLFSQHNRGATYTVTENIELITSAFRDISKNMLINAHTPNQYLWAYTDRFMNTPMFSSQFLATTDTVPFLQLVLHGTMDMFSPHVNFSFYSDSDVLRMIDYNVFPSFLFTMEPSFMLAQTNSAHLFSTEFAQYENLLYDVYSKVNDILRLTAGAEWINRKVPYPGIVINTYSNGLKVVINYTSEDIEILGFTINALSARGIQDA